jgi:hypothetical protein
MTLFVRPLLASRPNPNDIGEELDEYDKVRYIPHLAAMYSIQSIRP